MDFKWTVFVLSILVASVSGVCNNTKAQGCMKTVYDNMNEDDPNCAPVEQYKTCVLPLIDTCDNNEKDSFQRFADIFKDPPFSCKVDFDVSTSGGNGTSGDGKDDGKCRPAQISMCGSGLREKLQKIKQEAEAEEKVDTEKLKERVCGLGQSVTKCLVPIVKKCKNLQDMALKTLSLYNMDPYNCGIDLSDVKDSAPRITVASLLTVGLALCVSSLFN